MVIEKGAQRLNLWTSLGQRGWSVLVALGVDTWIKGFLFALALVIWGWAVTIVNQLPFWAICSVALLLSILMMRLITEFRRAWSVKGLKRLDLTQIGNDCQKFRDDVFEFYVSRAENSPSGSDTEMTLCVDNTRALMRSAWLKEAEYRRMTETKAVQRFSHRLLALSHLLQEAGIKSPDLWAFSHNIPGIAAHIGAIGELLSRGLLKEARSFTSENHHIISIHMK